MVELIFTSQTDDRPGNREIKAKNPMIITHVAIKTVKEVHSISYWNKEDRPD